jgi:15-cis-phytoene synthase
VARDTNFYYSFLVLPARKRHATVAVWDFCRAVDDAVDLAGDASGAGEELGRWRSELAACFGDGEPCTAQGRELRPVVAEFRLPRDPFEQLIDGVAMDVLPRRYETFDDLREYCFRVASTVGLICIEIFGYRNHAAREYAVQLGLALQLTNILRDVPADLAQDRLYIPTCELAQFGCSEEQLRAARVTPEVRALLAFQAARARAHYDRARAALPRDDARSLVAARIMGAIYEAILRRIEGRGYDVFSETMRIARPRRALIAGTVWARTMIGL